MVCSLYFKISCVWRSGKVVVIRDSFFTLICSPSGFLIENHYGKSGQDVVFLDSLFIIGNSSSELLVVKRSKMVVLVRKNIWIPISAKIAQEGMQAREWTTPHFLKFWQIEGHNSQFLSQHITCIEIDISPQERRAVDASLKILIGKEVTSYLRKYKRFALSTWLRGSVDEK